MPSYPALRFHDAPAAIAWLESFGFETTERHDNPDGTIAHAELWLGDAVIMLGSGGDDLVGPPPEDLRAARSSIYIGTPDVEAIHARARKAGTEVSDLFDQDYGSRDFHARDPGGNHWTFGTYIPEAQAAAASPDSA
jgi:uncharacterized glyoxalase superfamily protein PhnB